MSRMKSAREIAADVRAGKQSARDVLEGHLAQIAAREPELHAFNLVLADVPCSGTGTLSRNPEIRHRLQLDDLPRQAERQRGKTHATKY